MTDIIKEAMERLDQQFPRREMLTRKEVAEFLGVSTDTVSKHIKHQRGGKYSKIRIAHYMTD